MAAGVHSAVSEKESGMEKVANFHLYLKEKLNTWAKAMFASCYWRRINNEKTRNKGDRQR